MAPFASPEELSLDTGEDYDRPRALVKLEAATNAIISEIGWDPRLQVGRTHVLGGSRRYYGSLFLPASSVTAVTMTADLVAVPVAQYDWDETGQVQLRVPFASVVVITYTAGFSPLPAVLKDVCIEDAARRLGSSLQGPLRSRSWTIGAESESETYMGSVSELASPLASDRRLDPYRLTAVVA